MDENINDEINKIIETTEDKLKKEEKDLIKQQKDIEKSEVQRNILKLMEKNFNMLESRSRFREVLENDLITLIQEDDEDMTPLIKTKLYEIISNSEANTFASATKMFTDLTKSNNNLLPNDDGNGNFSGMTRENMQDIAEVMKFISQVVKAKKQEE